MSKTKILATRGSGQHYLKLKRFVSGIGGIARLDNARGRHRDGVHTFPSALVPVWIAAGALAGLTVALLRSRPATATRPPTDRHRVADVMVKDVRTIEPDLTIVEAAQVMRQENVGALPIVLNGKVIGMITDRDVVVRALAQADLQPSAVRVIDCATRDPVLGHPGWTLERALLVMAEHQIGRLPVVDDNGQLVGLVTLSSVALHSHMTDVAMAAAKKIAHRSARVRLRADSPAGRRASL